MPWFGSERYPSVLLKSDRMFLLLWPCPAPGHWLEVEASFHLSQPAPSPKTKTKVSAHPQHSIYTSCSPLPPATTETHRALEPLSQNDSGPLRRVQLGHRNFPSCQARALLHIDLCPASLAHRGKIGSLSHPENSGTSCGRPASPGSAFCPPLPSFNSKYVLKFNAKGESMQSA